MPRSGLETALGSSGARKEKKEKEKGGSIDFEGFKAFPENEGRKTSLVRRPGLRSMIYTYTRLTRKPENVLRKNSGSYLINRVINGTHRRYNYRYN